jgi:hypothetical protein
VRHSQTGDGPFNEHFADCGGIETEYIAYGIERKRLSFVQIRDPIGGFLRTSVCVQSSGADSAACETIECILKDRQHQSFYRRQILARTPPAIKPARHILLMVGDFIRCAHESLLTLPPYLMLKWIRELVTEDQSSPMRRHSGM